MSKKASKTTDKAQCKLLATHGVTSPVLTGTTLADDSINDSDQQKESAKKYIDTYMSIDSNNKPVVVFSVETDTVSITPL